MEMIIARMGPRTLPCCARDAAKSDQADSALEGVAHAGQGAHQRGLDGVDGLRVKFSRSAAYCSSMEAARPRRKGTGLRVQL